MSWFLSAPLQPFSIAAIVLLGLVVIEILGVLIGSQPSDALHSADLDQLFEGSLSWLNLGRVPLLILLMILIGLFVVSGMLMQAFLASLVGPLPALPASGIAGAFALAATGKVSHFIARIMPRDETYALTDDELVGRVGTVTVGPLEAHVVGKISVVDGHGNRHFPRARPDNPDDRIEIGAKVLIVSTKGREYRVIRASGGLADEKHSN